jgi:hypothetical protein
MAQNCSEKDISVYRKPNCMKCLWPQTVFNGKYQCYRTPNCSEHQSKLFREGYISVKGTPTVQSMAQNCSEKDISVLYRKPNCMKYVWLQTFYKRIYQCYRTSNYSNHGPKLFWEGYIICHRTPTVQSIETKLFREWYINAKGPPTVQSMAQTV